MAKDLTDYQDIVGRLAYGIYTPLLICFPLENAPSQSQIIDILTRGLEQLSDSFPWLAGQVVCEDLGGGKTGQPTITRLDTTSRLIVKDYTHDDAMPSMEALRKAKFPFSMLEGTTLTSLTGAPSKYGNPETDPAPVFFLQANFIKGGLLLNFAGEHSAMDGQGVGQIIQLFSKACHNVPFTAEELLQGNRARGNIIPLLDQDTYKPGPELDHLIVKPSKVSSPATNEPPPQCTWAYFQFQSTKLSKLKSLASPSSSKSENANATYITTNDAVSAFIWQSVSRTRSSRLPPKSTSTFARAVDVRSCLSIPPSYLGALSNHTYNTLPVSSILSSPLGSLASSLRLALNPSDLSYAIRSLATQLFLTPDKSTIRYGADLDLSSDIFFSSWAKLPCYDLDFNLGLGFPESVRRPKFYAIEGLMYLMPIDRSGRIDAAICLRDDDMEALRHDPEFVEFAEWIG